MELGRAVARLVGEGGGIYPRSAKSVPVSPQVAEVLGLPEGTIRSRLRRAKEALADKMASLARSPELLKTTMSDLEKWVRSLRAQLETE
mgnify:CR=1 FL=1